jgi:hypothetical protein
MRTEFLSKSLKGRDVLKAICRWEDNNKMDLKETGWEDMNLVHLVSQKL